eukprot:g17187.t1
MGPVTYQGLHPAGRGESTEPRRQSLQPQNTFPGGGHCGQSRERGGGVLGLSLPPARARDPKKIPARGGGGGGGGGYRRSNDVMPNGVRMTTATDSDRSRGWAGYPFFPCGVTAKAPSGEEVYPRRRTTQGRAPPATGGTRSSQQVPPSFAETEAYGGEKPVGVLRSRSGVFAGRESSASCDHQQRRGSRLLVGVPPATADVHVATPGDDGGASVEAVAVMQGRHVGFPFPPHNDVVVAVYDARGGGAGPDGHEARRTPMRAGQSAGGCAPPNSPCHDGGDDSNSGGGESDNCEVIDMPARASFSAMCTTPGDTPRHNGDIYGGGGCDGREETGMPAQASHSSVRAPIDGGDNNNSGGCHDADKAISNKRPLGSYSEPATSSAAAAAATAGTVAAAASATTGDSARNDVVLLTGMGSPGSQSAVFSATKTAMRFSGLPCRVAPTAPVGEA